jgi:protein-tyrosine phosphatase
LREDGSLRQDGRPWIAALLWLAALVAFFFLGYGFANWAASQRHNVPSIVFAWEHHIPFLPWTIVPYWSTDLFYTVSFFLCRDRKELDSHAKRILAAQVISVTCFLLFPLRFSFEHPPTSGLYGWLFQTLGEFDKPFNQAPSLHLSLTTILWAKYSEHTRGFTRLLLRGWFVLVGVSTLTTYQHHFIDILPGIWVGLACIALFPTQRLPTLPSLRSARIALIYFASGSLLGLLGFRIGGLGWLLFWPASALWIVAAAYWIGAPGIFQRHNNRMEPARFLLLAPYVTLRWIHARWRTRGEPAAHEIAAGVWLGRSPLRSERDALRIASMVHLAAELPAHTSGVVTRSVPLLDLVVPTVEQLDAAVAAIDDLEDSRPTLVCCAMGYSRSAASVAAWLVANDLAPSVDAAITMIQARRPAVVLTVRHREQLQKWALASVHQQG